MGAEAGVSPADPGAAVIAAWSWAGAGELAGACAAAGVSPAAAKAIAHPISLIVSPCSGGTANAEAPRLRGSIGAAFRSLKRRST